MPPFSFTTYRSVVAVVVLASVSTSAGADEPRWRGDYVAARKDARRLDRPIVVVVASRSCGWCRELERTTLRDPRVVRSLNETTVPMKIDVDDPAQAALVEALQVEGLPTIAAVGPDGRVIESHEGYLDGVQFLHLISRVAQGNKGARR